MTFTMTRMFPCAAAAVAAACALAVSSAADAQGVTQSATSADGLLTVVLSSANASDTTGVNNTYTWTAINNSATVTLQGVVLGSSWGDWCGGGNCTPPGPTLIALGAGCAGQGPSETPLDAHFGAWCSPVTGVALAPGQSISGSVTLRPGAGGPPDYMVYSLYDDPVTGTELLPPFAPVVRHRAVVAPAPTDIQLKGAASNGAPAAGSTFSYTFEVKNAGPWGT